MTLEWIQGNTKRDYSQKVHGKDTLVVGDTDSRRRRWCGFERINGDHLQGTMVWVQENTERDYSQRDHTKNVLVFGDGGDSENPQPTLIQGHDDGVDLRG
jgi:hypothetical protein